MKTEEPNAQGNISTSCLQGRKEQGQHPLKHTTGGILACTADAALQRMPLNSAQSGHLVHN